MTVARTAVSEGSASCSMRAASSIAGIVVMRSSSTMRGFVSET